MVKAGYKKTEVGVIPEDWNVCCLGDAVEFLDGKRKPIKASDRAKIIGEYPYYGASGIVDYVNGFLFDDDLILLGEDGENILSRSTRLAFRVSGKIWVNNHAHVLKPNTNFDINYLCEYLESLNYTLYNTGTAQPKLNKQTCKNIEIVHPPLQEQKDIAQALSDIDALIEGLQKLIAKKQNIKTAAMQQLLTGKIRLPDFGEGKGYQQTELGEIPEDWTVKPLRKISPSQSVGLVINPSSYFDDEGTVPMLVGSNIGENKINWESANRITDASNKLIPASRLAKDDLVTVRVGEPGVTAVVPPVLDGCNCASMMIVRKGRFFSSLWLCYVMNSRIGSKQVEHVQYGTAQKQFNISDAINFLYPCPKLHEQHAIAQVLSDMNKELEALQSRLDKTKAIKQGMMQELLTGRTRLV